MTPTPAQTLEALCHEADGAHAAGNHILAGALASQANMLRAQIADYARLLATQAEHDGDPAAATAITEYANEMEM